ncbi:MAG: ZIP family metal transporter [Gemmatimonadetes bacterium]|nr:ZIP family metal transporter [Gemmatimonadota bacterium]
MPADTLTILFVSTLTAITTGLGAIPFLFTRTFSRRNLGLANALAAGLMIAASLGLLYEGGRHGIWLTAAGGLVGVAFVGLSGRLLAGHKDLKLGALEGADARRALLIIGVMTVHSLTEGVGMGVSFGDGEELGLLITLVIAIHNIPEGLAISLVLVPKGTPVWRAAAWSIFSSLPQPLVAVPAFLAVETFTPLLGAGLGFAAGAMLWMSSHELVPEAVEDAPGFQVAGVIALGVAGMILAQVLLQT